MEIPELIRKEGLRRGLSPRTIKTYRHCVGYFFRKCHKDVKEITKADIHDFLDVLIEKGAAGNTINVYLNALKFLYEEILHKRLTINIRFSKTPKTLPTVLTKEETKRLIEAIPNQKHQRMIKLMYSAGLRVSELVKLKVHNIEFQNRYGWVRNGKGGKDRLFVLAESIIQELKEHIQNECQQDGLVFKGRKEGMHYSVRSIQQIIKRAAKQADINKAVHPHTLRHSFATHLIENGSDVVQVQSLLGHASPETSMVYVHTAGPRMISVKSPLDVINNHNL